MNTAINKRHDLYRLFVSPAETQIFVFIRSETFLRNTISFNSSKIVYQNDECKRFSLDNAGGLDKPMMIYYIR